MNMNETIKLEDLALTDDQQAEVKGGPVTMPDMLISSYQTGGHDGGGIPYSGTTTVSQGVLTIKKST